MDMTALLPVAALLAGIALLGRLLWLRRFRARAERVIVDGSNVLHWKDQTPDLASVRLVTEALRRRGKAPAVFFDANAGYKVAGRYIDDDEMRRMIGRSVDLVIVAPSGTPADALILRASRDTGAPVVTNDRFRDWAEDFPEVRETGRLVRGRIEQGTARLDW